MRYTVPGWLSEQLKYLESHRLLVLHKHGPFSFSLKQADQIHRVKLSDTHSCTCQSVKNNCLHITFVLCKILRIGVSESLLASPGLTPRDLGDLLTRKHLPPIASASSRPSFPSPTGLAVWECPICFSAGDEYSFACGTCANYVHASCLHSWGLSSSASLSSSGSLGRIASLASTALTGATVSGFIKVKCPLCRGESWPEWSLISSRAKEGRLAAFMKKTPWPGTCCKGCGMRPIRGTLVQAVASKVLQYCEDCKVPVGSEPYLRLTRKPVLHDDLDSAVASQTVSQEGWNYVLKHFGKKQPLVSPTTASGSTADGGSKRLPELTMIGASLTVLASRPKKLK